MKIALVSEYFYPKSSGGTEKYVYELAKKLIAENNEVEIITVGLNSATYEYDELTVNVIDFNYTINSDVISGVKPSPNLNDFDTLIRISNYDLIHFHTLTPAFNLHHIEQAKKQQLTVHFTAHIPAVTCVHGDLMQFGKAPCDGLIVKHRCTACYLSKKITSTPLSHIVATSVNLFNYPSTISQLVNNKKNDLLALNTFCDKIYLFTHWQHRIFIANGFDEKKIELTSQILNKKITPSPTSSGKKIRKLGFVGRLSPEKGLHILIKAFIESNRPDLQLHIAGIRDEKNRDYLHQLENIAHKNATIFWHFNLNTNDVKEFYSSIDALCIPSIWYETGPFVLYEAFENHLPVIANNIGDMKVWKQNGYHIELYHNQKELTMLLSSMSNLKT